MRFQRRNRFWSAPAGPTSPRRVRGAPWGPAVLTTALCSACSPGDAPEPRPNILLVSIDTLRADHLSCYGYGRETSPRLDRLAAEGVLFERALSSTSWTLPAHLSMLTGQPISAHGICDDRLWTRADGDAPIPAPLRGRFVSETLSDAGYATAGFYTWKYLENQFGFGPGFDVWERLGHTFYTHPEVGPEFERLRALDDEPGLRALVQKHPELFDDTRPSSPETIDAAASWLEEHAGAEHDDPFFLFVHLFDVHDPYVPPAPFDTMFDPDYAGPIDGRRITAADSPVHAGMAARDLENLVARYDGGIAWVDSEVARLLDRLDELGLTEDTLVVVTSDHGEEFFEHGGKTHRGNLHMESVAVPLLLRWPGVLPAGRRVDETVGLVDIAPTLSAAAGVLDEHGRTSGVDLLPAAKGASPGSERTYLSELFLFDGPGAPERHVGLVRGDEHILVVSRGTAPWRAVRYDLAQDRWGSGAGTPVDRSGDEPAALDGWLDRLRGSLSGLRASLPERGEELKPLDDHDKRQLASMGYSGHEHEFGAGDEDRLCIDGCVWPDR